MLLLQEATAAPQRVKTGVFSSQRESSKFTQRCTLPGIIVEVGWPGQQKITILYYFPLHTGGIRWLSMIISGSVRD